MSYICIKIKLLEVRNYDSFSSFAVLGGVLIKTKLSSLPKLHPSF